MSDQDKAGEAFYNPFEDLLATTWAAIDVAPAARGESVGTPPAMLARSDGLCLLYAGKVHAINSESEAGKTWLALHACAERMLQGEHVVFIDFEDAVEGIVGRLLALGVPPNLIEAAFHYVRPDEPLSTPAALDLETVMNRHNPVLTIVDGVTEAMVLHGFNIENNNDAARFMKLLVRPLARSGTAVLLLDHLPKDKTTQGRYAIGAQHKLAGLDGAVYKLESRRPFGRGRSGHSSLQVSKDRPGFIRARCRDGKHVATLALDSAEDGAVAVSLTVPGEVSDALDVVPNAELLEEVSRYVEAANAGVTTRDVRDNMKASHLKVQYALAELVAKGYLDFVKRGRAKEYTSVHAYRVGAADV